MMIIKMIVIFAVITVLLFFAGENSQPLQLHFGSYETIPAPSFLIIMISLLTGMFIALIISFFDQWKLRAELRKLKKDKKKVEGELNSLRKMPIVESEKTELSPKTEPGSIKGSA